MLSARQEGQKSYLFFFFITDGTSAEQPELYPSPLTNNIVKLQSGLKNYVLSDIDFANRGGQKTRYQSNIEAIKLVKLLDEENRAATLDEQKILARYVGWGGIPQAFDEMNASWAKEHNELKELLDLNEYRFAEGSVLNAHYTSKTIIDGIYSALAHMGFTNGKVLEPSAGTGNFIGLAPNTFNKQNIFAVELDEITGKIAKYLYPASHIEITGFGRTNFKNDEFDAVITNVPFGAYHVYDRDYDKYSFFIHDYFIAKSIDKIRPGGICVVITSKGTLDKASTSVRKHLADRAELLGAIRLPNTAFKESAGTEVTTDILFFQKRAEIIDSTENWISIGFTQDNVPVNQYYLDNPQMLLGTMRKGMSMYGSDTETYLESDGRELGGALTQAISYLPKNIYKPRAQIKQTLETEETLPADYNVRNFCYEIIGNRVYLRQGDKMHLQKIPNTNFERIFNLIRIRKQARRLLEMQINNCTDEQLNSEQYALSNLYDRFIKRFGFLNSKSNRSLFRNDADYALLVALEHYDETLKEATKTDIFSKRTIRKHTRVERANNSIEALQISKNELGKVDIRYIEKLTDLPYETIIRELESHIYQDPLAQEKYLGWETATEYLSGNIRKKLQIAQAVNNEKNIKALELALPEDLTASQISVRMGATWVDAKYYEQFLHEKFNIISGYGLKVKYEAVAGVWGIDGYYYNMEITSVYGTARMNAMRVAECTLNLQTPSIYDTIKDVEGKDKQVLNKTETILVREKQNKLQTEFKNWIFDDPERRNDLARKYNDLFNNTKLASYDGSYLTFPEMNPCIELKDYQKDAVERIIVNGNTMLHHVVGAGKTFEMVASAMKLRQYGLVHKPMFVVPNHLVMQWTREFKLLYPNSNVLMATKKDLEKQNRLKFVSRIATGDWDAIIIAASSFEKIPLSMERQQNKLNKDINDIETALITAREDGHNVSIKNLQKVLKNKEAQLKKLMDSKKDDLIKFEDLGVDSLFIDEAHKYKNKFIFTKMNNVAGISNAMSQRATDLDMKTEFINELHKSEKGVVFATGTPISNSMVEMFTMQSYLQRKELRERGIQYFDAWAANFGETQNSLELAPSGQGYRTRTRFAKFTNLPELLTMYRSFSDVKTADMLNLPTPKANKETIIAQPSDDVLRLNAEIQLRADKIYNKEVKPEVDNMLKITSDGKKLALDPRCFDSSSNDNPCNKVNLAIQNMFRIWKETQSKRLTQIVFCDLSVPKIDFANYDPEKDFDVYNDIKHKLVKMGIPENEIRFIHEANTDIRKQTLFDDVRNGNVRILLGSTEKCGAGTNIQDKLYALHHLDTPYRPSDLAQREGRIVRQGNKNDEVWIYTYVTERTFDSYSYQILENKQKFIAQIDRGDLSIREAKDIDETALSYAEIKAITTANPKIKQKMELEQEISRLQTLEREYRSNKYRMQDAINSELPQRIKRTEIDIENTTMDIARRNASASDKFFMQLGNKTYTERKEAGDLFLAVINSGKYDDKIIGRLNGFDIIPISVTSNCKNVVIRGNGSYQVEISTSETGSIIRLENFLKTLESRLSESQARLVSLHNELATAKTEVIKSFEYADTLSNMREQLAALDAELDLNKQEVDATVVDDEQFKDESAPIEDTNTEEDAHNDD
jgi:N12 class adenine-specific DNA methylase